MRAKFKVQALRKNQNANCCNLARYEGDRNVLLSYSQRIFKSERDRLKVLFEAQLCVSDTNSLGLSTTDVYAQLSWIYSWAYKWPKTQSGSVVSCRGSDCVCAGWSVTAGRCAWWDGVTFPMGGAKYLWLLAHFCQVRKACKTLISLWRS